MADILGGLISGVAGGAFGAIGGAFQSRNRNKMLRKIRRQVREGISSAERITARSTFGIMSTPEWLTARNFIRSFYGISPAQDQSKALLGRVTEEFGEEATEGLKGKDLSARFSQVGRFAAPVDVLAEDFQKGLRQAQAVRGLTFSQASASAEASGLAAFRAQLQTKMLPQLFGLAEAPAALRARFEPGNLQREVFRATGGAVAFGQAQPGLGQESSTIGSALSGFAQGFGGGASIGLGFERLLQSQGVEPAAEPTLDPAAGQIRPLPKAQPANFGFAGTPNFAQGLA
jgi:hypothetical protein